MFLLFDRADQVDLLGHWIDLTRVAGVTEGVRTDDRVRAIALLVLELKSRYSGLIPAALTTSGQRFSSALMNASNCCGVPPTISAA